MSSDSFIPGSSSGIQPTGKAGSATDPTISSNNVGNPTATTNSTNTHRTDTHGNIIVSSDPTTRDDAKPSSKLAGDVKGAIHGTVGSMQAAAGAAIRSKGLEEKGLEKMSEEDARLGAKRGVPPVGSGTRNTTAPASETQL